MAGSLAGLGLNGTVLSSCGHGRRFGLSHSHSGSLCCFAGLVHSQDTIMQYTELADGDIVTLLQRYTGAVGSFVSQTKLKGGYANSNLRIDTDAGPVLLKVFNEKPKAIVLKLVEVLLAFRAAGVDTAFPIADRDGIYVHEVGGSVVALFDFLKGTMPAHMTPPLMAKLGISQGRVHKLPVVPGLPAFAMGAVEMEPFLRDIQHAPLNQHPFVATLRDALARLAPLAELPALPRGMLHADIFPDNTLYDADSDRLSIIDWEEICEGALVLDVAMTVIGCAFHLDGSGFDRAAAAAFMHGYRSERAFTALECEVFPAMLEWALLSVAFWRFRQFQWRHPERTAARDKYREMVDRIAMLPEPQFWRPLMLP